MLSVDQRSSISLSYKLPQQPVMNGFISNFISRFKEAKPEAQKMTKIFGLFSTIKSSIPGRNIMTSGPTPPPVKRPFINNPIVALIVSAIISSVPGEAVSFPFSRLKTGKMAQGADAKSMQQLTGLFSGFRQIVQLQGWTGLYRGCTPVAITAAPAYSLLFGGIAATQHYLGTGPMATAISDVVGSDRLKDVVSIVSGFAGQALAQIVWTGSEVTKERMQLMTKNNSTVPPKFREVFSAILKKEGILGFYRGAGVQFVTFGIFNSLGLWGSRKFNDQNNSMLERYLINLLCFGGAAGATGWIDVLKTRMQVRKENPAAFPYKTSWGCFKHILRHEGPRALVLAGIVERVLWLGINRATGVTAFDEVHKELTRC